MHCLQGDGLSNGKQGELWARIEAVGEIKWIKIPKSRHG